MDIINILSSTIVGNEYLGGVNMKRQSNVQAVEREKIVSIMLLFITSILIIVLGVSFSIFSVVNNISFRVLSSQVHGAIFGLVIIFLGVRYFLSVRKLKSEVYKTTSKFSWNNFKKKDKKKTYSNSR